MFAKKGGLQEAIDDFRRLDPTDVRIFGVSFFFKFAFSFQMRICFAFFLICWLEDLGSYLRNILVFVYSGDFRNITGKRPGSTSFNIFPFVFRVNGHTFVRSNFAFCLPCLPCQWGHLLKKRVCSFWRNFFLQEEARIWKKGTRKSQNLFHFSIISNIFQKKLASTKLLSGFASLLEF